MIYRNKIERENRQQLHLTRCLWFAPLTQMPSADFTNTETIR